METIDKCFIVLFFLLTNLMIVVHSVPQVCE